MRVGVIGATGYTGFELVRLLMGHPEVELAYLTSRAHAGQTLSSAFPSLRGLSDIKCEELDPESAAAAADSFFLALPHGFSQKIIPSLIQANKQVVDLAADFRLRDLEVYRRYYGEHSAPELSMEAVYGLPELHRQGIKDSRLVANPGCYPTAVILALAPLLEHSWIEPEGIVADAKSGVSGAGRGLNLATQYCEIDEACRAYSVTDHRHLPEMEQELAQVAGHPLTLSFTPHLVPMSRGILATIYARFHKGRSVNELRELYSSFYQEHSFIRVLPEGVSPSTASVRGSNFLDLGLYCDSRTGRVVVVSCLDNLGKGAASQAVQNFNLMNGLDEVTGLTQVPWTF
jgi:N-acetyl-gamma-glutamyl-phosphate reductase